MGGANTQDDLISEDFVAGKSLRSPRKLFIFISKKNIFRIKVSKKNIWFNFEKSFTGPDDHAFDERLRLQRIFPLSSLHNCGSISWYICKYSYLWLDLLSERCRNFVDLFIWFILFRLCCCNSLVGGFVSQIFRSIALRHCLVETLVPPKRMYENPLLTFHC